MKIDIDTQHIRDIFIFSMHYACGRYTSAVDEIVKLWELIKDEMSWYDRELISEHLEEDIRIVKCMHDKGTVMYDMLELPKWEKLCENIRGN